MPGRPQPIQLHNASLARACTCRTRGTGVSADPMREKMFAPLSTVMITLPLPSASMLGTAAMNSSTGTGDMTKTKGGVPCGLGRGLRTMMLMHAVSRAARKLSTRHNGALWGAGEWGVPEREREGEREGGMERGSGGARPGAWGSTDGEGRRTTMTTHQMAVTIAMAQQRGSPNAGTTSANQHSPMATFIMVGQAARRRVYQVTPRNFTGPYSSRTTPKY